MQLDFLMGCLIALLFLLGGLKIFLAGSGFFRGFSEGFWAAVFNRLIVGSRQPPGDRSPLGCLLMVVLALLLLGCVGPIVVLLLTGLAGSIPVK